MGFLSFSLKTCAFFILVCFSFVQFTKSELDDEDMYPIIINTQANIAIIIAPEIGCHVLSDARSDTRVLRRRKHHIFNTDGTTMDKLVDLCENFLKDRINATQFVEGLQERAFLIYPGTHFCGAGNNAANESDLGKYVETDKCCREHDSCPNFIDGWNCHPQIPELCNSSPFTRSHCSCDEKFRQCIQNANDTANLHIGILYFTVFGFKCFREDYPIIECEEYGGFLNLHCQKYKLDYTKEPTYQFFDSPKYSRKVSPVNITHVLSNLDHQLFLLDSNDMENP